MYVVIMDDTYKPIRHVVSAFHPGQYLNDYCQVPMVTDTRCGATFHAHEVRTDDAEPLTGDELRCKECYAHHV